MKKYLILIIFIFSINCYSQSNVKPGQTWVDSTFEKITEEYPNYYVTPGKKWVDSTFEAITKEYPGYVTDEAWWYGKIVYYNTAIPGNLAFYFHKNRCYAIKCSFFTTDSVESMDVFNSYISYVTDTLLSSVNVGWEYSYKFKHMRWSGVGGLGAIAWRPYEGQYTVWISFFRGMDTSARQDAPKNKPKLKIQ